MNTMLKSITIAIGFVFAASGAWANDKKPSQANDYPTQTKVLYVLQCMDVNGKSPEILQKCSCGIDAIASQLPFSTYETAEIGMQMTGVPGVRAAALRQTTTVIDAIDKLRKAQADSNLRCF